MNSPESDWTPIEPLLDEAMDSLSREDRDALLLRFFENKSLREVGENFGASEDAAQKRVSRAVEQLRQFFTKRGVAIGSASLLALLSANVVQAAPIGLGATISSALSVAAISGVAAKTLIMTTTQKILIAATAAVLVGISVHEAIQISDLRNQVQQLQQQQKPLAEQNEKLNHERDEATKRLAALQQANDQLRRDAAEIYKLRDEITRLKNSSPEISQTKASDKNDPTEVTLKAWLNRVKLLKQRFEEWPGKKTPELELLTEQDWLDETQKRTLETDNQCRDAMGQLRNRAKYKFGEVVNEALEQFYKSNNRQLPTDLAQLLPYLKPPINSFLEGYEIAKPGWVKPPQPSSPNSERAESWAIVPKGSFTPNGVAIRDGTDLPDPEFDSHVVIYRGGTFSYGK
ncbi:MAG: hypothetical protein M3Y82_04180, partial [Verrucomicrobiota bacterium]|nr:hypothetical protein [Verrucomicrobiota bacterium]